MKNKMSYQLMLCLFVTAILVIGCGGPTQPEEAQPPAATQVPSVPDAVATQEEVEIAPDTAAPLATTPQEDVAAKPTIDIHCTETDPHPVAQGIAETYQVTYEEVMTFFCTGVGFEDIVLAYQTADLAGIEVEEALTLWYDFGNWEDVWGELGLE
jgi:hypothetical protein